MEKRPSKEQLATFKKNANDQSLSAEVRAKFQAIVDKFENVGEEVVDAVEGKKERKPRSTTKKYKTLPKPKMVRLISSTKQAVEDMKTQLKKLGYNPEEVDALDGNQAYTILEELKSKMSGKPKKNTTIKATKQTGDDIEKAKAEIKARTGKTEEECEKIVEEYRALRTKSQERKKKEAEASKTNVARINKLKKDDKVIEGTNEKTADAVIETTTKDVAEKIEKQIEAVEEKAETEAKKEVEKEMPKVSATEKKKAVKEKVEEKVKDKTKTIVKRVVIDTSALLTTIAESLGKFDKDSQKEFLIKLRSDIDKLLAKYSYGGMTSGATQGYNITQSNLSSSSVNMFGGGGGVDEKEIYFIDWTNKTPKLSELQNTFNLQSISFTFSEQDAIADAINNRHIWNLVIIKGNVGYDVYKYNPKTFNPLDYGGSKMFVNGGGVGNERILYKVVAYQKSSDYDKRINGYVIADDYLTRNEAEKTRMNFKNSYPYVEIEEYMGKDPYKMTNGGVIKVGDNVVITDDSNENYYDYLDRNLIVTDIRKDRDGDYFYDLEDEDSGEKLPFSFYENEIELFSNGGGVYNRSWHQDHYRHNKRENYEIPMNKRKKYERGGTMFDAINERRGTI